MFQNKRANKEAPRLAFTTETPDVPPTKEETPEDNDVPDLVKPETVDEDDDSTVGEPIETELDEDFMKDLEDDILKSKWDEHIKNGGTLPSFKVDDLIGRTFIDNPDDEGVQVRAKVESAEPVGKKTADKSEELY